TRFRLVDLLHGLADDLLLRDGRLLVISGGHPRRRAGQKLAGGRASRNHEFEGIGQLGAIDHLVRHYWGLLENVCPIASATPRIHFSRGRAARPMARNLSAADESAAVTTMKSFPSNDATSSRATSSRHWMAS